MILNSSKKITPPEWMVDARAQKLMEIIGGAEGRSRFVGGCVRNQLLNRSVEDIDIATQFTPVDVMACLKDKGVKAIPTGIDYGTVTAVIDSQPFEITTLRKDIETDGRHADVAFTDDWGEDAKRRDFTMNTLLADMEGNIYDPTGQGLVDLKARRVVFVGEPAKRIAEDYLRILRFFRFHAFYGQGEMDQAALQACQEASDKISSLSRERITSEFLKILSVDMAPFILKIMFDHKVLSDLVDKNYQEKILRNLYEKQSVIRAENVLSRLFVMAGNKARLYEDALRLSHAQKNFLVKLEMAFNPVFYADEKAVKKAIFHHGNELMLQGYLLLIANGQVEEDHAMIDTLQNWQAPQCPITGDMLIAEGYVTGPDLGQELTRRQEEWLESII